MKCQHTDDCLVLRIMPSGEYHLVCRHTNRPLGHIPRAVYLARVNYHPTEPALSRATLRADFTVPVECQAGEQFELHGGYVDVSGCTCQLPLSSSFSDNDGHVFGDEADDASQ